ncbi:hypothetical protein OWV82_012061 [Melia azedarach]|uniref:Uncharacterized protein n=1 Tax=Melia azedarach TaxID=155640 RepID=A0ACC1Y168_MELAZ|nr:hypothetical protein OWV82_012061 [Melia azedarach]
MTMYRPSFSRVSSTGYGDLNKAFLLMRRRKQKGHSSKVMKDIHLSPSLKVAKTSSSVKTSAFSNVDIPSFMLLTPPPDLSLKRYQELASSSTKKLNELTVKLKSAIDEANHYKDRATKSNTEIVVQKAKVGHHKVIRKQLESSLELENKELEREKAEHVARWPAWRGKFLAVEKEAEEDSDLPDEVALSSVPTPPPETTGPSETGDPDANFCSEAPNAL